MNRSLLPFAALVALVAPVACNGSILVVGGDAEADLDASADTSSGSDSGASSPDGPSISPVPACSPGTPCTQAGGACQAAGCAPGVMAICDHGNWMGPTCAPRTGCPAQPPADGTVCDANGPDCDYFSLQIQCACSTTVYAGQTHWKCSPASQQPPECTPPPTEGSTCATLNPSCRYYGGIPPLEGQRDWSIECYCPPPPNGMWYCPLNISGGVIPSSGSACIGVPRGYPARLFADPNTICVCNGDTDPRWTCTPCPQAQPAPGTSCAPEMQCSYSSTTSSTTCLCSGGQWGCF